MGSINKSNIITVLKKHFKREIVPVMYGLFYEISGLYLIMCFVMNYYSGSIDKDTILTLVLIILLWVLVTYEIYIDGIAPLLDYILMDIVETPDLTGPKWDGAIYGLCGFYGPNKVIGAYKKVIYPNNKKVSLKEYHGTITEKEHGIYRYQYLRRSRIIVGYIQIGTPPKKKKKK